MKRVRARLGCARIELSQQALGTEEHKLISGIHVAATIDLITRFIAQLSNEDKSSLQSIASKLPWHDGDLVKLLRTIQPQGHSRSGRRRQQKYTSFLHFIAASRWRLLNSHTTTSAEKLELLFTICVELGLRLPQEFTIKWITSVWACLSERKELLLHMGAPSKQGLLNHVKAEWAKKIKTMEEPILFLEELPATPLQLLRDQPAVYHSCFPDNHEPVECPLELAIIRAFDASYKCRGNGNKDLDVREIGKQFASMYMKRLELEDSGDIDLTYFRHKPQPLLRLSDAGRQQNYGGDEAVPPLRHQSMLGNSKMQRQSSEMEVDECVEQQRPEEEQKRQQHPEHHTAAMSAQFRRTPSDNRLAEAMAAQAPQAARGLVAPEAAQVGLAGAMAAHAPENRDPTDAARVRLEEADLQNSDATPANPEAAATPAVPAAPQQVAQVSDAEQAPQESVVVIGAAPTPQDTKHRAAELVALIRQRDAERKQAAQEKKKRAKELAKEEAAAAKALEAAEADAKAAIIGKKDAAEDADIPTGLVMANRRKLKLSSTTPDAKQKLGLLSNSPNAKKCKRPSLEKQTKLQNNPSDEHLPLKARRGSVSNERSRGQVRARVSDGPSISFKYGEKHECSTEADAIAAANAWLRSQNVFGK